MRKHTEERRRARELYIRSGKTMPLAEIARRVGRPACTVGYWKRADGWDEPADPLPGSAAQVAAGSEKDSAEAGGLDEKALLWEVILYQYEAIVRAHALMHGEACGERSDADTGGGPGNAWERHAAFLRAQSRAVAALNASLKTFCQMVRTVDADRRKAQPPGQKPSGKTETKKQEIRIHTHIPRPGGRQAEKGKTVFDTGRKRG